MLSQKQQPKKPFYIIGPYKYGSFEIPQMNLLKYGISLLIYTLLLPFLYKLNKTYLKLPNYIIYILYFIYAIALFYFFGIVSIGYIIYKNTSSFSHDLLTQQQNSIFTIKQIYSDIRENPLNPNPDAVKLDKSMSRLI